MPAPTPISLDGEYWRIIWVKTLPADKRDGKRTMGRCSYRAKKITVATAHKPLEVLDTLCHELVHATDSELTEPAVIRRAKNYSNALWAAGYRRLTDDERTTLGID